MRVWLATCAAIAVAVCFGVGSGRGGMNTEIPFSPTDRAVIASLTDLPDPPPNPTNRVADRPEAIALGRRLFFDQRLSRNGDLSCASCHDPAKGWSDGRRVARGLAKGTRNTPSLWNVSYGFWFFWDGRADSLWALAGGPIENPIEMGSSRRAVLKVVHDDESLAQRYRALFGELPEPAAEPPTIDRFFSNVGKAFEAFERTLIARESRFDSFARGLRTGDQDLVDRLEPAAQRGLALFIGRARCIQCHHGPGFSDGEFHNLGLDTPEGTAIDVGRYDGVELAKDHPFRGTGPHSDDPSESANQRLSFVTRKLNNFGEFKTPSLRNVAQTGPYMHDGRFESLRDVVEFYSTLPAEPAVGHREESLRRLALSPVDIDDLVAFLRSLTDDHAIRAATSTSTSPPPRTKRP